VPEADQRPAAATIRPTRWAPEHIKVFIPGVPTLIPPNLDRHELEALLARIRIEEISQKLQTGMSEAEAAEDRGPSPPPLYDTNGKRINTKEQRSKDKMVRERYLLIQQASKMYPMFRPPSDYRPMFFEENAQDLRPSAQVS